MSLATVRREILQNILPAPAEARKVASLTRDFLSRLNKQLRGAKAILGGSGAKGTWLSGNYDVDVFVLFEYSKFTERSMELSELLEPALKKAFPRIALTRLHGSRDYFQLQYQGSTFEVIPILKIANAAQAKNITDVSPLHATWVKKHVKRTEEVLLAKQFCKAQGLYGAESYIGGFSGYVLEILMAQYGSCEKLFKASQKWKEKDVVDVMKHYPKKDAAFHLNKSKQQSPLLVIDPVDKSRNAAAALSAEKWNLFRQKAREFLARPSVDFFVKKEVTPHTLREEAAKSRKQLVLVSLTLAPAKEDVNGTKLVKVFDFLKRELQAFSASKAGWEWDKGNTALLYYFLGKNELPAETIQPGPPLSLKPFVDDFKKKHPQTFVQNGRIMAKVKVPHPRLGDLVQNLLRQGYVKERVVKATVEIH